MFYYESLLEDWGLSTFIPSFKEEGIDDESFNLLDEETIKTVIKKCGPRLVFKNKYSNYLSSKTISSDIQVDIETVSTASTESATSTESSYSNNFISIDVDEELSAIFKVPEVPIPTKKPRIEDSPSRDSSKQLEEFFKKTAEGQLILANRGKLSNDHRCKIAKIVVNYLTSFNNLNNTKIDIKTEQFQQAAKDIVALFPGENPETYFIPYCPSKHGLRRQPARGKLWSRYANLKAAFRLANSDIQEKKGEQELVSAITEEENIKLDFLRVAIEPFDKVLSYWEDTFQLRKQKFKSAELHQIYEYFPSLKLNAGIELLEADFNKENCDKINIIYQEWPKVAFAIVQEGKDRNLIPAEKDIFDINTEALLTLPYLFSPITVKNSKSGLWRPSRVEVQESFFVKLKDFALISELLERRSNKLLAYDLPCQPFAVHVEETNSFYIIINETKYSCDTAVRCLELLYKSIHALNLEYPSESKHIWYFIQEMIFKTKVLNKFSTTSCAIADISYHLKNMQ